MPDPLLVVAIFASFAAFLFGLVVGSFANVVIHRLPREESIVFPSSRCPRCGAGIRPWQNIPVLSWLMLRGRCASCREPISARYPAIELLHGAGFALVVWTFGLEPFTLLLLLFLFGMVVLAFIDWDHQILPDVITLPGILIGVLGSLVPGALVDWKDSMLAALFGYGAFFLVAEGYMRLRGIEGLGQGDWKLAALMGSFLGSQRLMLIVFLASLSGMTYGLIQATRLRRETALTPVAETAVSPPSDAPDSDKTTENPSIGKYKLPFGTFLAGSAVFVLFCGDPILRWYASLFRP